MQVRSNGRNRPENRHSTLGVTTLDTRGVSFRAAIEFHTTIAAYKVLVSEEPGLLSGSWERQQ